MESKEFLTSEQAAGFLGISLGYLYKLTSGRQIPHFKPHGKKCYFAKSDLMAWIQKGRVSSNEELQMQATAICMRRKGGLR